MSGQEVGHLSSREFQKASVMGGCEENLRYIWLTGQCALHLADEETGPEMLEERFG